MPESTSQVTEKRAHHLAEFVAFKDNFQLATTPAHDLIPLLARGEQKQTQLMRSKIEQATVAGARHPLPRLYTASSSSDMTHSHFMADKMNVQQQSERPETSSTSAEPVNAMSFDIQNREVDAAMAATPSAQSVQPHIAYGPAFNDDAFNAMNGRQNLVANDDYPYSGKMKRYNKKNKKFNNGDRSQQQPGGQPHPQHSEGFVENGNGTVRKYNNYHQRNTGNPFDSSHDGRKYGDDGDAYNNKLRDASGRFNNRAPSCNDNNSQGPPRKHFNNNNENAGFRAFRGNPNRHQGGGGGFDHGPPAYRNLTPPDGPYYFTNTHFHPSTPSAQPPPVDAMGFRTPHGMWYPHAYAPQPPQFVMGPPPPFMHVLHHGPPPPPPMGMQAPIVLPARSYGPPPMPPLQPQITTTPTRTIPAATQTTPSTSSVMTVVPTTTSPAGTSTTEDPRPAHMRITSLLSTVMSQLEDVKLRFSTEEEVVGRHLDAAMGLCRDVQAVAVELANENARMRKVMEGDVERYVAPAPPPRSRSVDTGADAETAGPWWIRKGKGGSG